MDVPSIIRVFVHAGTVVRTSVRSLWLDAKKRATDISEGVEKIKQGREQVERGVRGK